MEGLMLRDMPNSIQDKMWSSSVWMGYLHTFRESEAGQLRRTKASRLSVLKEQATKSGQA
jgi:hypothetical protein